MAPGTYRDTLTRPGLQPFLWTQFFGAFSENLFKIVVSLLVVHVTDDANVGRDLFLVGAIYVLPFLLFSGYAGQLADQQSKRTIMVTLKRLEVMTALLACSALATRRVDVSLCVLFLFSLQAAFFSPAKYGILPELLPASDLSRANGLLEMSTFVAIVTGTATGSFLFGTWQRELLAIGGVLVLVAVVGAITSVRIPTARAVAPVLSIRLVPWTGLADGLKQIRRNRTLSLVVVSLSYFWFLGALLQLLIILFGARVLHLDDRWIGALTACAAVGIGLGSLAAGRLSRDSIDSRLVPVGSAGMGLFAILLALSTRASAAAAALTLVGFCGGLFVVPLNAMLQQGSDRQGIGRVMATNNFLNMAAILLASSTLGVCSDYLNLSPDRIIFVFGAVTLGSTLAAVSFAPAWVRSFTSASTSSDRRPLPVSGVVGDPS